MIPKDPGEDGYRQAKARQLKMMAEGLPLGTGGKISWSREDLHERCVAVPQREFLDISRPIKSGMAVWPGDPEVVLELVSALEQGDPANVARLSLGTHTGTHVDAPCHLLVGGADAASLLLEAMVGAAEVWDLTAVEGVIQAEDLAERPLPARLLLKTRNSSHQPPGKFAPDFVALHEAAANFLVKGGVGLVGVDGPSVDPFGSRELPTHRALLIAGVVVLEGLNLREVPPGPYHLICLPLPLVGADGAPARAVLTARTP